MLKNTHFLVFLSNFRLTMAPFEGDLSIKKLRGRHWSRSFFVVPFSHIEFFSDAIIGERGRYHFFLFTQKYATNRATSRAPMHIMVIAKADIILNFKVSLQLVYFITPHLKILFTPPL